MTTAQSVGHLAISASAGSGKTFQLTQRYLRLLASGVRPEEIIALTFSRKAAGEIFDAIINHLCNAASSEEAARLLGERIDNPALTQASCVTLLRTMLDNINRLHVSTLDSFSVSILRTFPLELGITPGFSLTDSGSAAAEEMRAAVLEELLFSHSTGSRLCSDLLEFFAQASEGRLDKQVRRSLNLLIATYQSHFRTLPEGERWGNAKAIWPCGTPWLDTGSGVSEALEDLRAQLSSITSSDEAVRRWEEFLAAAGSHTIHSPWDNKLTYLFTKLSPCVVELRQGSATVKLNRAVCDISTRTAPLVLTLLTHVVATELNAALTRTQGIHGLLAAYERSYDAAMRRSGILTFLDVQHLLASADKNISASHDEMADESRLYIDYRLDARLNHWLLDEFQDTSDLQWRVLENLVDEVMQDDSGRRSLFYVGDVKQAIYGWRGGNPRLFDVPLSRYPGLIDVLPLHQSYRSCPAIIATVNRVFGGLEDADLPQLTVAHWQRVWEEHHAAPTLAHTPGFATVLEPPCDGGMITPSSADRYRLVANLLNEIQPLARGLTVAVLVRSNEQGKALVDQLRGSCPGMAVIHEGRAAISDNAVVALLRALMTFAAHPGDTMAWQHLQMSPLQQVLDDTGLDRETLSPHLLRSVQGHGFQETLKAWAARLNSVIELDPFGRMRLEQLLAAAGELDSQGVTNCDRLLAHIDRYEIHDVAANDALRVMTVHQAKGLGFDVVILPELERNSLSRALDVRFLLSHEAETERPRWALEMPRRVVAECDETLRQELQRADSDAAFESLCLLYVAMTRARRGLYLVTSFPGKTSTVLNQPALVKKRLHGNPKAVEGDGHPVSLDGKQFTCLYAHGDERWYQAVPLCQHEATIHTGVPCETRWPPQGNAIRTRLVAVRPSDSDLMEGSAAALFAPDRRENMEAGTAVHSLFQRVTWWPEVNVDEIVSTWRQLPWSDERVMERAMAHFRTAMSSAIVRTLLSRPAFPATLWLERSFDVVIHNRWITGKFDRVVVEQDIHGPARSATLLDFKTDNITAAEVPAHAALYRQQLRLYGDALGHILGLPLRRIRMVLLFTGPCIAHEVRPEREAARPISH